MKPGDEVVCLISDGWYNESRKKIEPGPKLNEVCLITGVHHIKKDTGLDLKHHTGGPYNAIYFAPVLPTEAIEELMSSLPATKEVELV